MARHARTIYNLDEAREVSYPMRCEICDETMVKVTFREAAPDYWVGREPAPSDLVYTCWSCGTIEVIA